MATRPTNAPAPRPAPLRLNYGRLAVAAAGLAGALALVVGGVLAPFGVVPASVPLAGAAVLAASFAALRYLAVRARRRKRLARMEAAFAEAMAPAAPARPRQRATEVFDAQPGRHYAAAQAPARAQGPAPSDRPAPRRPSEWRPVEVPRPTYADAPKAERPEPEPLPAPEPKKPQAVTSIRKAEAAAAAEAADRTAGRAPATAPAAVAADKAGDASAARERPAADSTRPVPGGINLDAVLQRRRA